MDYLYDTTPVTGVLPWLNIRAEKLTSKTVNFIGDVNMNNNKLINLDTSNLNIQPPASTLDGLADTTITEPSDNHVLAYDAESGNWSNKPVALNDLGNVDISEPTDNQVLAWDNDTGYWKNKTVSGSGEIITWDSIENKPLVFPPDAHQHVMADITDLTLPSGNDTSAITLDPTGFDHPENVYVIYDKLTRKISLAGSNWKAYWRGVEVPELTTGWESSTHDIFEGNYYVYWDAEGLIVTTTPWNFDKLQIAFISFHPSYAFALRECHGCSMDWATHRELHQTIGTYLISGGDFTDYILNSTTEIDRRPSISEAVVADEDLRTTLTQLIKTDNLGAPYGWFSLTGVNEPVLETAKTEIINTNTGIIQYNSFAGTWGQSSFTSSSYGKIYVIALPTTFDENSQYFRYLFIQPQQISGSLSTIQAVTFNTINFGTFSNTIPEFVPIAEIIVRRQGSGFSLTSINKISGTKQLLTSASIGLTSVSADSVTIFGNGTPSNELRTIRLLPYTYGGTFTNPTPPTVISGNFYIDATNRYLIISKTDNLSNSHASSLALLDYGSQISIQVGDGKVNRYSIIALTSNQTGYVEFSYDGSLSNIEDGSFVSGNDYEMNIQFNPISKIDHLADVYIDSGTLADDQLLQYDTLLGWTNKTVSLGGGGGGGISPMVQISHYTQFSMTVSQYNIGDPSIINVANPTFINNNAVLPINPTWSQHGVYPSAVTFNPQKPATIKVDWSLDVESFPAQNFEIGYGFIDGTMTSIDKLRTGTKVYNGSFLRYYDAGWAPPILFYFALRCTTALNQSVTINKFCYTITCDRVVS